MLLVAAVAALAGVERPAAAAEVGAGAEAAPRARDDHRAHVVVGVDAVERVDQLLHHRRGERVEPLRAVQGDGRHAIGDVIEDLLEGHGRILPER